MEKRILLTLFIFITNCIVTANVRDHLSLKDNFNLTRPIITKWNTNINNDNSKSIILYTDGAFSYTYKKVNDNSVQGSGSGITGESIINFPQTGEYIVSISPDDIFKFKFIDSDTHSWWGSSNNKKFLELSQWGDVDWNTDLSGMFTYCSNLKITATDIPNFSNVTSMFKMFHRCTSLTEIPNINNWNTSSVTNMSYMFAGSISANGEMIYNQNIGNLDTSNVIDMSFMFALAQSFNQNIKNWNVSNVTNMAGVFYGATNFNQDIKNWDVSKVTNMSSMFEGATNFNQSIGIWNTSNVTNTSHMFSGAINFNNDVGNWNTSKVINMGAMFKGAKSFNKYIGEWNTSIVTSMAEMFSGATTFNQDIGIWNTTKVLTMLEMFLNAQNFNQNIGEWDTFRVSSMNKMFSGASSFNQDLGNWWLKPYDWGVELSYMFDNSGMSCENYSKTLYGWATKDITAYNRSLGVAGLKYGVTGEKYRNKLINEKGWTFTGDSFDPNCNFRLATINSDNSTLKIYPIPVTNVLRLSENAGYVEFYNATGQKISSYTDVQSIDTSYLVKGTYFIILKDVYGKEILRKKIIKN